MELPKNPNRKEALSKVAVVEKYGLEAVPSELRTTRWYDYWMMQFAFSFNAGNFLLPSLAVLQGHLSFTWAVFSIISGSVLAYILVSLLALPGVDYGIPGQYAIRMILGERGSRFFSSLLRVAVSMYWFAVQALGAAVVVALMLKQSLGISISSAAIAVIFTVVLTIIAMIGFRALTSTIRIMLPLMLVVMVTLAAVFFFSNDPSYAWSSVMSADSVNRPDTFLFYAGLAFAQYITSITGSADLCRYARSRKDAFFGMLSGHACGLLLTAAFAAYVAIASGEWNPYVAGAALSTSWLPQILIIGGVVVSLLSINLNNAYSGGFSLLNAFPRFGRLRSTVVIGAGGGVLVLFPVIIDNSADFIAILGSFALPLAGVLVADYVIVRKMRLELQPPERASAYPYIAGFQIEAFAAMLMAYVAGKWLPSFWPVGMLSCLAAAVCYLLIVQIRLRLVVPAQSHVK